MPTLIIIRGISNKKYNTSLLTKISIYFKNK